MLAATMPKLLRVAPIVLAILGAAGLAWFAATLRRGTDFEFLRGHQPIFTFDPGSVGFVGEAFTWQEDYKEVVSRADSEFAGKGLIRDTYRKGIGVGFTRPMGHPLGSFSIDIQP